MYYLCKNKIFTGFLGKKLCCPKRFFLVLQTPTSIPKKLPKNCYFFFFFWNTSISTWQTFIHLVLICEVNNMRTFVFWAIMASLRRKT
jgi:hypothetical protein